MVLVVRGNRHATASAVEEMNQDRERNVHALQRIIDEHGWPTTTLVGEDGFEAAWVIAQHADFDITFQKTALELMEALPLSNPVYGKRYAYLKDRVLVNSGQAQLFGTQFTEVDGKMTPRQVLDPQNLDKRRKQYGLEPFGEYMKHFEGSNRDAAKRQLEENEVDWTSDESRAA
jgi:hypothetical protein